MTPEEFTRLKGLYLRTLRVPPAERDAFLDTEIPDDPQMRAEVESLLRHDRSVGRVSPTPARLVDLLRGSRDPTAIGPYELLRLLGRGGMGEVWLARQQTPIQREVALKLIKLGMDTRQFVARFELERQTLATLQHPGIASIFDAGATEEGRPYLVMEYVPGPPVTTYCRDHRLDLRTRLDLFARVCHAIEYAHQRGVIHRDLKPANVLIAEIDGRPHPKIIDFGLAKVMTQGRQTSGATVYGSSPMGTPAYMSPEQADPRTTDIDTRTDVYSLGAILYELLTGQVPVDADTLDEGGLSALHLTLRAHPIRPPSQRVTGRDEVRRLRPELDWITTCALEADRERRYPSAAALAADVRRKLDGAPVVAGPPSRLYAAKVFVRRHRVALVTGLLFTVAAAVGGFFLLDQIAATRAERNLRVETVRSTIEAFDLAYEKIEDAPGAMEARRELMETLLERLEAFAVEHDDREIRRLQATTLERHARFLGDNHFANVGDTKGAIARIEQALDIQEALYASEPDPEVARELAWTHATAARLYGGEPRIALAHSERALALTARHPPEGPERLFQADMYNYVGFYALMLGRPSVELANARRGLAMYEELHREHPDDPGVSACLGAAYALDSARSDLSPDEAVAVAERGVRVLESVELGPQNRRQASAWLAGAHFALARARRETGDHAGMIESSRQGLAIYQSLLSDSADVRTRTLVATGHHLLGEALIVAGDHPGGSREHERAHEMWVAVRSAPATPDWGTWGFGFSCIHVARARLVSGRLTDALEFYRAYCSTRNYLAPEPSPNLEIWSHRLEFAEALRMANRRAEALGECLEAHRYTVHLDTLVATMGVDTMVNETIVAMYTLDGDLLSSADSLHATTTRAYERAVQMARSTLGEDHELTRLATDRLACWSEHGPDSDHRAPVVASAWSAVAARRGQPVARRPDWGTLPRPVPSTCTVSF